MKVKFDIVKTIVLFIVIHMMIAWVAERKEKKSDQQSRFTKSFDLTTGKTNKLYDPLKTQLDQRSSKKTFAAFQ